MGIGIAPSETVSGLSTTNFESLENLYHLIGMRVSHIDFRELCRQHGLAATHQREVIYAAVTARHGHFSPEDIYELVRKQIPAISLATVYKNVKTFVNTGMLREVSPHYGSLKIDSNPSPHHHVVCTQCKSILDIEAESIGSMDIQQKLPAGFRVQRFSIEIHGLCGKCSAKGKQSAHKQ
ncbi:MAG TPA: Fur family transcriptional regulator [Clostridia bacterium]|nr:Fur family transcriptional regulator [Clostridia bacterium]